MAKPLAVGVVISHTNGEGLRRFCIHSGRLPEFDAVALRVGDPAEAADAVHLLRLLGHVRARGA